MISWTFLISWAFFDQLGIFDQVDIFDQVVFTIPRGPAHVFKNNAKTYEVILKMKLI